MRRPLIALASASLLVGLLGGGTAQAVSVKEYRFATISSGVDTGADRLSGHTIRDGATAITIPAEFYDPAYDSLAYIGRARDGSYLVGRTRYNEDSFGESADTLKVTPSATTTVSSIDLFGDDNDNDILWRLNDSRTSYLEWDAGDYGGAVATARDAQGTKIRSRAFRSNMNRPLDYRYARVAVSDGGKAYTGQGKATGTLIWNTKNGKITRLTRKTSVFADLGRNMLATRGTNKRWAWTSISRPNRVKWQAWFLPMAVSPNGK